MSPEGFFFVLKTTLDVRHRWNMADWEVRLRGQQTTIDEARAEQGVIFDHDGKMRADPTHGVVLRLRQPVTGRWLADDVIDLHFMVELDNRWAFSFRLLKLEIRLPFGSAGGAPQGIEPRLQIAAFGGDTSYIPVRWHPSVDRLAVNPVPDAASILPMTINVRALLDGPFGEFDVPLYIERATVFVPPMGSEGSMGL